MYNSPDNATAETAGYIDEAIAQRADMEHLSVRQALGLTPEAEKEAMDAQAEEFSYWNGHNWTTFTKDQIDDLDADLQMLEFYRDHKGPILNDTDNAVLSGIVSRWESFGLFPFEYIYEATLEGVCEKMYNLQQTYHHNPAEHGGKVEEFKRLVSNLTEGDRLAVLNNLFASAYMHPEEVVSKALWTQLRAHQPEQCPVCKLRNKVDGEYSCGHWDCYVPKE
jgi:hypothetical protein